MSDHPDNLREFAKGDFLKHSEVNALRRGVRKATGFGEGFDDIEAGVSYPKGRADHRYIKIYSTSNVPAYSLFGASGNPAADGDMPQLTLAALTPASQGSQLLLLTNESQEIIADTWAWCRVVGYWDEVKLASSAPVDPGHAAGPCAVTSFAVSPAQRYGLVALTSQDADGYQHFVRTDLPGGYIGLVTSYIEPGTPGRLGSGRIAVYYRTGNTTFTGAAMDPVDGAPLTEVVFNLTCQEFMPGTWVQAFNVVGVGLVVTPLPIAIICVELLECMGFGDTVYAKLCDWGSDSSVSDSGSHQVEVDNAFCNAYGIKGERFLVFGNCDASGKYTPLGGQGLTRRIEVDTLVEADDVGYGAVLTKINSDDPFNYCTEETDVPETSSEDRCVLAFTNKTLRKIKAWESSPAEKITVHAHGCCWIASSAPRLQRAFATLKDDLCGQYEVDLEPGSVVFLNLTLWEDNITKVFNPFGWVGCQGDKIKIEWNEDDNSYFIDHVIPKVTTVRTKEFGSVSHLTWSCDICTSESSSSPSSSSPSSSDSSSDSSSPPSSSPPSTSGHCDFTGTITVGQGNLHRSGDSICETQLSIVVEDGWICEVNTLTDVCDDVCDCGSDSSSDPPSSSEPSSTSESQPSESNPSTSEPSTSEPSTSEPSTSEPSTSESVSDSGVCNGTCTWEAVAVGGSDSDSTSGGSTSCGGNCTFEWNGSEWTWGAGDINCTTFEGNCGCLPPSTDGTYVGETAVIDCNSPPGGNPSGSGSGSGLGVCCFYVSGDNGYCPYNIGDFYAAGCRDEPNYLAAENECYAYGGNCGPPPHPSSGRWDYIWIEDGTCDDCPATYSDAGASLEWQLVSNNCAPVSQCGCQPPAQPPLYAGQTLVTSCADDPSVSHPSSWSGGSSVGDVCEYCTETISCVGKDGWTIIGRWNTQGGYPECDIIPPWASLPEGWSACSTCDVSSSSSSGTSWSDTSASSDSSGTSDWNTSGSGDGCPAGDCSITVAGVSDDGCSDCDTGVNGSFTFENEGDGDYFTNPTNWVCSLYDWALQCEDGVFTLTHGAATGYSWTGTYTGGGSVTLNRSGTTGDTNCSGWPSSITLNVGV